MHDHKLPLPQVGDYFRIGVCARLLNGLQLFACDVGDRIGLTTSAAERRGHILWYPAYICHKEVFLLSDPSFFERLPGADFGALFTEYTLKDTTPS